MKDYMTTAFWIQGCIESCINMEQLENSLKLIRLFHIRYQHPYMYKHLITTYSEHKSYLNHEEIN